MTTAREELAGMLERFTSERDAQQKRVAPEVAELLHVVNEGSRRRFEEAFRTAGFLEPTEPAIPTGQQPGRRRQRRGRRRRGLGRLIRALLGRRGR